ncbi:TetR/AcrR family transcriptional regulator [Pseudooceanicola nitratireducens]|uniref:TetR/AcrR family transcriptional regulator n=1 Tax=Pseudooceanicola nitratireducens TaxID=517719 RepID=UPI00310943A3
MANTDPIDDIPQTRDRRKELLERDLMEKACALFASKGYGGTSLADIAQAVGLTRAAVYYYFKNKEAVLEAIVNEVTNAPLREIEIWRSTAPEKPADQLRTFVEMRVRGVLSRQVQMRMIEVTEAALPEDLLARHTEAKRRILEEYRQIIRAGIHAGEFKPSDERITAFGIIGMVNWSVYWVNPDGRMDSGEIASQLAEMAVRSVSVDKSRAGMFTDPKTAIATLRDDLEHLSNLIK